MLKSSDVTIPQSPFGDSALAKGAYLDKLVFHFGVSCATALPVSGTILRKDLKNDISSPSGGGSSQE